MRPAPKKQLGQNFLRDGRARHRIVDACGFSAPDIVLEIGPGQGAMTPLIAGRCRKVYAVELDPVLAEALKDSFAGTNVSVLHGDILSFDIGALPESRDQKIRVFGNIPYYITSPIIERLFGFRDRIADIHLTVQKEFARRICAGPGSKEYGSFSCFVQYYSIPKVLFDVNRNSFYPVPKVDSSFISLVPRERPAVEVGDETKLFSVIRHAFQQRRKTIRNGLKDVLSAHELEEAFNRCGIDPATRPERLSLRDFAALSDPGLHC
jgi:16S rRNA (adenine1518-N6/adenine1519-N6)-dimethyltransferase